ncbi:MAG: ABC transporter permease, partial [Deltaproteobacteria bacterium]
MNKPAPKKGKEDNLRHLFWKRFRKNRLAMIGAFIVVLLFAVALLAPHISPYDPGAINIKIVL